MPDVISVIMRTLHIASVVTLLGGIIYARLIVWPGLRKAEPETRSALEEATAAAFRPVVFAAIGCLLVSGLYNLFSNPGHSPRYHILFGIKLLFALHVFGVAAVATQPHHPRRARLLTGTIVSGLAIVVISAYLRRIF
jgi:uncharacterized membrane protein